MSKQYVIVEGKKYDKLIEEGMQKLNVKKEDINIEVLETKKQIFSTTYKVKISLKNYDDSLDKIEKNLEEIISSDEVEVIYKQIDFEYKTDGVYLTLNENVSLDEVKSKAFARRIQNIDFEVIQKYISNKNFSESIKIAEAQEEEKIDSKCQLNLSKDLMEAYLLITPPVNSGDDITEQKMLEFLQSSGIVHNIKNDVIKKIAQERQYDRNILIAEGDQPQHGTDAKLEFHFDTSNERKVKIDAEGKIDFHELSLIKNVTKGNKLVTLIPDTQGTPGRNVLGKEIQAKDGKKINLPKGKNVEATEDGLHLIATIDGEVKLLDAKVSVFKIYEVPSNVDNSTGNIRFVGKVVVKGNVLTGFEIEADDDVEVFGVVEGARIVSKGNIILHRGIQGMNKGELYCEGDLIAKFIENSRIEAKGNVHSDAIMHSHIICGKKLEVVGRKGLLVGGVCKVAEEIKAKVIGSPMATVTELEVGVNPDLRHRYETVKIELKQTNDNLEKTSQAVELLTKISKKTELPEEKKFLLSKSIQLKIQLQVKLEQLNSELKELEANIEETNKGKIKASDIVYAGSRIIIGSSMLYVKDVMKYVSFYRSNAEIRIGPFED